MTMGGGIRGFANTLAARLMLVLTLGMASASIVSLFVAERARVHDFERVRRERVVASAADMAQRFAQDPTRTADLLRQGHILGAREAPREWTGMRADPELAAMLRIQLGSRSDAEAKRVPHDQCFPEFRLAIRVAGMTEPSLPDCWYVQFRDADGISHRLAIDLAPFRIPPSSTLDPLYLLLIVVASTALSFLAARAATTPLRRLTDAARTFSVTVDPEPIPETGPQEVRIALATFNLMQHRVRDGFRERTQILASITHDLQTPLTRLRLRLEQVEDDILRDRLISDLSVTQHLVRDGLELARSSESREPWSVVDIETILSSIAEDAAELGANVHFVSSVRVRARVKPNALGRCVTNLVENAVRYGGDAEIHLDRAGREIMIGIRDHGPGIPEEKLEEIFEPFRRLSAGPSVLPTGSGLGLTIATAQAQTFGAAVTIRNHPGGGVLAEITWRPID